MFFSDEQGPFTTLLYCLSCGLLYLIIVITKSSLRHYSGFTLKDLPLFCHDLELIENTVESSLDTLLRLLVQCSHGYVPFYIFLFAQSSTKLRRKDSHRSIED